jgi:hypothetical protein
VQDKKEDTENETGGEERYIYIYRERERERERESKGRNLRKKEIMGI